MNKTTAWQAAVLALALSLPLSNLLVASEVPERESIAAELKWDLAAMYASAQDWERDVEKLQQRLPELAQYKGRLAENGKTLLAAIELSGELSQLVGNLYVYAGMKSFEDQRVSENAARFSRANGLISQYNEATAFFSPELLAIPAERLEQMIADTKGLAIYRHYLDEQSRLRDFTLSEAEERILALAGDPLDKFGDVFGALNNADIQFPQVQDEDGNTVELSSSRYGAFQSSPNREVRKNAWQGLHSSFEKWGNTLAANYEGHVKGRVFNAKVRGYESALHAATYSNGIPTEVYINLIAAAREGAPALQSYLQLRRQALGVETLEVWDLYAPITENVFGKVSWDEAKQIVADGLSPLGEDYIELYWRGFEEGWVDAVANRGKRSGAYSWGTYTSKPYLSMNYEGTLSDVSTLAHEYGHSLHSYMARHTQPYVYGDYRTFIAEIASMTNEAILFQNMLAKAKSDAERAYLLQNYLNEFRSGFFRQVSFADFEWQAHQLVEEGEALTKESLNNLYADVFAAYYGDAVHTTELNASEWSRIPHFLRGDNFYVYQYATSFVAATALAKQILDEGEPARERFLTMLSSGSNDYPIELLKKAGVDMTTPKPIYETLAVFEQLTQELATVLARLEKSQIAES